MAHFAKVLNNKVVNVIVAEPEFFDGFIDSSPGEYIQCSYNTIGGIHRQGGVPLRYNFPAVGDNYDPSADAFYGNAPYPSWVLNSNTFLWEPPVKKPTDGKGYNWNEENQTWDIANGN